MRLGCNKVALIRQQDTHEDVRRKNVRVEGQGLLVMDLRLPQPSFVLQLSSELILGARRCGEGRSHVFIDFQRPRYVAFRFSREEKSCRNDEQKPKRGMTGPDRPNEKR